MLTFKTNIFLLFVQEFNIFLSCKESDNFVKNMLKKHGISPKQFDEYHRIFMEGIASISKRCVQTPEILPVSEITIISENDNILHSFIHKDVMVDLLSNTISCTVSYLTRWSEEEAQKNPFEIITVVNHKYCHFHKELEVSLSEWNSGYIALK